MTKFAFPALILCILALFSYSVTSQSNEPSAELLEPGAQPSQKVPEAENAELKREQPPAKTIDSVSADLQRLSEDSKANSDKIAETAALRADLLKLIQDAKSNNDKAAQGMLDQINALRSDQIKSLKDAKETGDKTAQGLRQEVSASQAKLVAQVDDMLKANTASSEVLAQRVDALRKDIDETKKNFDEERQSISAISPTIAFFVALTALILGPFLAYQLASFQLERIKQQTAAAPAKPDVANAAQSEPSLGATAAAETQQGADLHHEAPALGEDAIPHYEPNEDRREGFDREKV